MRGKVVCLTHDEAVHFLLPRHYSGRIPVIQHAFGWEIDGELKAVVTFGKPASQYLCRGVCGEEWAQNVIELNRLCRTEDLQEPLSSFVGACLRRLRPYNYIVVSYSDTQMHHNGYIYQACNFLYTGCTKERTDIYTGYGKHPRHYTQEDRDNPIRQVRSAKHRYIYFCTHSNQLKRKWRDLLNYPVVDYPKGENEHYTLGDYIKPLLVNTATGNLVLDPYGQMHNNQNGQR